MKRVVCLLVISAMLAATSPGGLDTSAQQARQDDKAPALPRRDFKDKLPAELKKGASPEAKAAWDSLAPEEREKVKAHVDKLYNEAMGKFRKDKEEKRAQKQARKSWKDILKGKQSGPLDGVTLRFSDRQGAPQEVTGNEQVSEGLAPMECLDCDPCYYCEPDPCLSNPSLCDPGPTPTPTPVATPTPTPPASGDADADGLPESFEDSLADAFTPIYHVSAYETDNFATFGANQDQILQRLGPNPFSYFRVQPLGFDYDYYGRLMSVLRIDYLTLWDHDSGLVTGGNCAAFPGLTALEGILAHNIDNERSAVLVAAPVYGYYFNLDPMAYSAYSYYTAAHEDTDTDKSRYIDFPTSPIPAGWHIHLAHSLSKHATYTFNPDQLLIVPDYVIYSVIAGVHFACYNSTFYDDFGWSEIRCLAALYYAYGLFAECAVERFVDQGGRFASPRVNVGEPGRPINGALFIDDNKYKLRDKLVLPVF